MTTKEAKQMVTDHVIVRRLDRVEGYEFDDIRSQIIAAGKEPQDSMILKYLANKFGLFRGLVIFRIATKFVRASINAGAKKVHRDKWTLIISDGRVVTLTSRSPTKLRTAKKANYRN
jgi:hypothetical protein